MDKTNGLLKAYISERSILQLATPLNPHLNKPNRLGLTLAYGDCSALQHLAGKHCTITIFALANTPRSCFWLCSAPTNFWDLGGARLRPEHRVIQPPFSPHVTVGWGLGWPPVAAGEDADLLNRLGMGGKPLPPGWSHHEINPISTECNIEFQPHYQA
jgi:hypothetical protein